MSSPCLEKGIVPTNQHAWLQQENDLGDLAANPKVLPQRVDQLTQPG
jgi:hypothetical protein